MRKLITTAALAAGLLVVSHGSANAQAARHYDCTKAGNANKTACKGAATATAPAARAQATTARTSAPRHYDCSKPGNANKAVCKTSAPATSAAQATAAPSGAPAAKPSIFSRLIRHTSAGASSTAAPTATSAAGPSGATAQCKDNTYSHSAHRSGTCSRHGGVKTWF